MKAATTAFTFKTLLRHYAKRALTPRSLSVNVAVLCALSGNTTTCSFTMRLAALRRVQQQHLSSPSAGTRPCSSAKSELKTQKEGDYVPDSTTDVRDSLEVEKKEQDESHGSSVIPPGRERVQQGKDWSSAQ